MIGSNSLMRHVKCLINECHTLIVRPSFAQHLQKPYLFS
jgi:hypothetical protein